MKFLPAFSLALMMVFPALLRGQFEGELSLKIMTKQFGEPKEMLVDLFIKGEDVAFRVQGSREGERGMIIYRGEEKLLLIINDAGKSYLELAADSGNSAFIGNRMKGTDKPVSVRKTGKTKEILNYKCEEVIAEEDSSLIDLWGTPELAGIYGGFMNAFARMQGQSSAGSPGGWQSEMLRLKLFPLQSAKTRNHELVESQEVTKIDKHPLGQAMFNPPEGYTKQSIEFDSGHSGAPGTNDMMKKGQMQKLLDQLKEKMKEIDKQKEKDQDSSKDHE